MSNENKHGAILIAAFVANSILNYGFSVMLSWCLNPAEFGMLGVAQSLLLLSGMAVGSGFAWTAAHDIALSGVCEESRQSFRSSWVANTSLGVLLAGAFWVMYTSRFFPFGPNYFLIILFVGLTTVLLAIRSVFPVRLEVFSGWFTLSKPGDRSRCENRGWPGSGRWRIWGAWCSDRLRLRHFSRPAALSLDAEIGTLVVLGRPV